MATVLIVTDAWNQMNGVVTTLSNTKRVMEAAGYTVKLITPEDFMTIPFPTYKEIKLAINPWKVGKLIKAANAEYIHIATEGPLGLCASMYCRLKGYKFTTSYHTKMPEYISERFPWFPQKLAYSYMRFLHSASSNVLVTTKSMAKELEDHGFKNNLIVWGRGVDTSIFYPATPEERGLHKQAIALYVGRVSIEKNVKNFINAAYHLGYRAIVVGDGPQLEELKARYGTEIEFVGRKTGKELADYYRMADVFVFPSKTDTFGIVMLEAMACGTPVAGYNVTGPIDCVTQGVTGFTHSLLSFAVGQSAMLDRKQVAALGSTYTWEVCTQTFINALVPKN
jgi:glycosyltransferase involved in cell wall biosynthesis